MVKRIICGLITGILLGLAVPQAAGISILGDLFIGELRGIAPVLVFFLVMSSLCHMEKFHFFLIRKSRLLSHLKICGLITYS